MDPTREVHTFSGSVLSLAASEKDLGGSGCWNITVNILKEMTNLSLLTQNLGFLLISLSNFFIFSGYFIPFIFVANRAKELGIKDFSFILGLIG